MSGPRSPPRLVHWSNSEASVNAPSICHSQVTPSAGLYQSFAAGGTENSSGTEKSPIARLQVGPVHRPRQAHFPVRVLHEPLRKVTDNVDGRASNRHVGQLRCLLPPRPERKSATRCRHNEVSHDVQS